MYNRAHRPAALCFFALLALACSKSADDDAEPAALPANCSGAYSCTLTLNGQVEGTEDGSLGPREGACTWVSDEDPSASLSLSDPDVTIDGRQFSLAVGSGEYTVDFDCVPAGPASSGSVSKSTAPAAECRGSAEVCSLENCYSQDGCHYFIGSAYTGADDECQGFPRTCDEFDYREACERQKGCRWE